MSGAYYRSAAQPQSTSPSLESANRRTGEWGHPRWGLLHLRLPTWFPYLSLPRPQPFEAAAAQILPDSSAKPTFAGLGFTF
jgi:hypothetical protein